MDWQVYWKKWYRMPWYTKLHSSINGTNFNSHYAGIGPFQFHWYSSK